MISPIAAADNASSTYSSTNVATTNDSEKYVVGSSHTSFTGDETPTKLVNMTVGNGYVTTASEMATGFEYEPADAGAPDRFEIVADGDISVIDTDAYDGSQSVRLKNTSTRSATIRPADQPMEAQTKPVTVAIKQTDQSGGSGDSNSYLRLVENDDPVAWVGVVNGDLQYYDGGWSTLDAAVDQGDWVNVTIDNVDASSDTFDVSWSGASSGSETDLPTIQPVDQGYDETRLQSFQSTSLFDEFDANYVGAGGGDRDARYVSAESSLTRPAQHTWTNLTLENASAHVRQEAWTGSSWTVVNSSTYTTTGNYSLNVSGTDYLKWRSNISFNNETGATTARMHDERWLIESRSPVIENSSLTPNTTATGQDSVPIELSANISDGDFPTNAGDSLTVDWVVDGSVAKTTTVNSNGTATASVSPNAGTHEWHIEVTDEQGHTRSSNTASFLVPSKLRIYNESAPTDLVKNVSVELRFYVGQDANLIEERNTSDGVINMSGLPADEPFVVVANAENFSSRRIYVPRLIEEQKLFLLPKSADSVSPIFQLKDLTGRYSKSNTVLVIERALNGTYQTVEADYFGASGEMTAELRYNVRHRMRLINVQTGEEKPLGAYTPIASREQTLEVLPSGDVNIQGIGPTLSVGPSTRAVPATDGVTFNVRVENTTSDIERWTGKILVGGETVAETSQESAGSWNPTVNLSGQDANNATVLINWETADGQTGSKTIEFGIRESFENRFSLLGTLISVPQLLPGDSQQAFAWMVSLIITIVGTAVVGSKMRLSSEALGFVPLGFLSGFAIIGWIGYSVLFAGVVSWSTFFAIRRAV